MSEWQTPHASTRTSAWPRPGVGISRSTSSKSAPASGTCTARIVAMWPPVSKRGVKQREVVGAYPARVDRPRAWLTDMDGVLVTEQQLVPGADRFIGGLRERGIPFLVLTNNSIYTPRDLSARLRATGLEIPEESIWT